jgi:hypothetical protein
MITSYPLAITYTIFVIFAGANTSTAIKPEQFSYGDHSAANNPKQLTPFFLLPQTKSHLLDDTVVQI